MLSDVLGVLIAFVSVILLLSVVVTGLVQATQAVFRVRGRNLLTSVARFLEATNRANTDSRAERRRLAAKILNSGNVAVTDRRLSADPMNPFFREILGPTVSWVHARELAAAIKKYTPTEDEERERVAREEAKKKKAEKKARKKQAEKEKAEKKEPSTTVAAAGTAVPPASGPVSTATAEADDGGGNEPEEGAMEARAAAAARAESTNMPPPAPRKDFLVEEIKRAEPTRCKRFQFFMRLITIAWALIVAIGFQVSAPALFSSLAKNPAQVQDILAQQDEISDIAERAIAADEYDVVSDTALEELTKKFPDFEDDIAQAGNAAPTRAELLQMLEDVLPDVPERPEIVEAYSKLIDDQIKKASSSNPTNDAVNRLEAFGIVWWKKGKEFYVDKDGDWQASVIIGVLLTAILLTFGAPFWFEQLRNLAALRDPRAAAAAKSREREKGGAGSSDDNDRTDDDDARDEDTTRVAELAAAPRPRTR